MKLIGQGNVYNDKSYCIKDSNGKGYLTPKGLGYEDSWYGGMVKKIFTAKDGVYLLCDKKDNVINIGIPDVIEKVEPREDKQESDSIDLHELSRKELLEMAKKLDIEGKFATIKTEELIEKIKEAQNK